MSSEQLQQSFSRKVLEAFGIEQNARRECTFAFSTRQVPSNWRAFTFDLPFPFYLIYAPGARISDIKSLALGIKAENFVLLAEFGSYAVLVLRRAKKGEDLPLFVPLRKEEDYERVINTLRKFNFTSDELTAHSSINSAVDLLRVGAERYYTNRGLFSNHYLRERMHKVLSERGRNLTRESSNLLAKFGGELPTVAERVKDVLVALGYGLIPLPKSGYEQYALRLGSVKLDVSCVVASVESLDTKTGELVVPSYQAVASLRDYGWVILTNGRLWRLYSSRTSSSSTNYFEVDLEGIVSEGDPRLLYFTALFSASAFVPKQGLTDVDITYEGGIKYAKEIEENLRSKIFDGQLFLNLVRAVVDHSPSRSYSQKQLEEAKATALKLLYRILFILYAESRGLLPLENPRYRETSMDFLRERLSAFEKEPETSSVWDLLRRLFGVISRGSPEARVPEYDGALFEYDPTLDSLSLRNKFLVPALRDLTEADGRGIDYQNLGVRHLGSLYEALLEYSVRQAEQDLVVYKEEILDASYAADLKAKPRGFIPKGELYLSVGGLARKGTGSYFTPDEIVRFLVKKGLEPHLKAREERFLANMRKLRSLTARDPQLEKETIEDLLGLRVVDPAMGSGHFLVTAVDQLTHWIINLLRENPDAPLMKVIEEDRQKIISEQFKKGIHLKEDLLTDSVILKRMVMKRCVYGVDVNPLAVELAKLSLWLDSFAIGTPLTFLDHHIRCGDSLIGLWLENIADRDFQSTLDRWTGSLTSVGERLFKMVSVPADLTVEQVNQSRRAYYDVRERTEPLRILVDLNVAAILDPELSKKLPRSLALIGQVYGKKEKPEWWPKVAEGLELARKYRAFHWEIEFPDAFTGDDRGFDLLITNPPWEAVKPDDDDFFSVYYPRFRRIGSKPEKRKVMESLLKNPQIAREYQEYKQGIEQKVRFFKQSGEYVRRGSGDTNLWKLFLERSLKLLSDKGSLATVIPSGIVTDEGGKQLREALFEGKIRAMFEFENKRGIFSDIDRRYKFALLVWDKAAPTPAFPAAFYLHDLEALDGKAEHDKFVEIPIELIRRCAPDSLSIPEVRNRKQLEVFSKIYHSQPLLSDPSKGWTVVFVRELDRTNDSDLLRRDGKGWLLIEGKNFHQFIPDYEKVEYTVDPVAGLRRTKKHKEYQHINERIHNTVRLAFRGVASSTNVRSMVACILPPKSFSPNSAVIVIPRKDGVVPEGEEYLQLVSYLTGILNSYVFDFLIRTRISMNLNFFYVYQTPVPPSFTCPLARQIIRIAGRLSSADARFSELATTLGVSSSPLSMMERIDLTAKLNTLVAEHYGLNREEFELILQSFEGFEEDKNLEKLTEVKWNDELMRRFNGEVRKRILETFKGSENS